MVIIIKLKIAFNKYIKHSMYYIILYYTLNFQLFPQLLFGFNYFKIRFIVCNKL